MLTRLVVFNGLPSARVSRASSAVQWRRITAGKQEERKKKRPPPPLSFSSLLLPCFFAVEDAGDETAVVRSLRLLRLNGGADVTVRSTIKLSRWHVTSPPLTVSEEHRRSCGARLAADCGDIGGFSLLIFLSFFKKKRKVPPPPRKEKAKQQSVANLCGDAFRGCSEKSIQCEMCVAATAAKY